MLVMFDFLILGLNSNLQSHVDRAVVDSGVPLQSNLGTISNQLSKYLLLSKSESTNKAYTHSFQRWTTFIRSHGYSELPAKPVHVALYITHVHLLDNGASYASVNSTIYSIKWMHSICGLDDPTENSYVKSLQDSAKRLSAKPVRRKDPVDTEMLQSLCSSHKETSDVLILRNLYFKL